MWPHIGYVFLHKRARTSYKHRVLAVVFHLGPKTSFFLTVVVSDLTVIMCAVQGKENPHIKIVAYTLFSIGSLAVFDQFFPESGCEYPYIS